MRSKRITPRYKKPTRIFSDDRHLDKTIKASVQKALAPRKIQPEPTTATGIIIAIMSKIPSLARLLNRVKNFNNSAYTLVTLSAEAKSIPFPNSNTAVELTYNNLGIISAALNFLVIPLSFLASMVLKKPSPIKLTTIGEFLYSAVILGLTIAAAAAPLAAPIIGAALTLLGFGYSIYLLANFVKDRDSTEKELQKIQGNITATKQEIDNEKEALIKLLQTLPKKGQDPKITMAVVEKTKHIEMLYTKQTELVTQELELKEKITAYNDSVLLNYCVGFATSCAMLTGIVVGFFFPPIGVSIAALATVIGVGYMLSKTIHSAFETLARNFSPATTAAEQAAPTQSTNSMLAQFGITKLPEKSTTETPTAEHKKGKSPFAKKVMDEKPEPENHHRFSP